MELQGRERFRRQARKPPAGALNIWCGGTLGSQLRGYGETPGRARGLWQGRLGSGMAEAVRNESAGCAQLRLPTPRACMAGTQGLWPLTLNPSGTRLKRGRTRAGGLERGRCLADASALGVGTGNGNIPLEGAQPLTPQAPNSLLCLWRWASGLSSSLVEQVWSGEGRSGQESWVGLVLSQQQGASCVGGARKEACGC